MFYLKGNQFHCCARSNNLTRIKTRDEIYSVAKRSHRTATKFLEQCAKTMEIGVFQRWTKFCIQADRRKRESEMYI